MTIANLDDKCRAVEEAIERAKENALKIDATKKYGNVKADFYKFFQASILIKDLYPIHFFERDNHHATDGLLKAIPKARERLKKSHTQARLLQEEATRLLTLARKIEGVDINKADAKRKALEKINADVVEKRTLRSNVIGPALSYYRQHRSAFMRFFRGSHTSSKVLADALREFSDWQTNSELLDLVTKLDLFGQKTRVKHDINAFLSEHLECFGDLRVRKWIRVDHTPMVDLIELLEDLSFQFDQVKTPEQHRAQLEKLSDFEKRLRERKELKTERDQCVALAKSLEKSLAREAREERTMLAKINAQLAEEELKIRELRQKSLQKVGQSGVQTIKVRKEQEYLKRLRLAEEILKEFNPDLSADEIQALYTFIYEQWETLESWSDLNAKSMDLLRTTFHLEAEKIRLEELHYDSEHHEDETKREEARSTYTELKTELTETRSDYDTARATYEEALSQRIFADVQLCLLLNTSYQPPTVANGGTTLRAPSSTLRSPPSSDDLLTRAESMLTSLESQRKATRFALLRAETFRQGHIGVLTKTINERVALEQGLRERNQVRLFIQERLDQVTDSLKRSKKLWKSYKDTKTLVLTIRLGDDIQGKLRSIAQALCGGHSGPDAMGKIRVFLLIEAGVRAGHDFGIVNLSASVGAALGIGGTMAITDSREVTFSFHVSVFLTAKAEASIKLSEGALGETLPTPDLLVEASARCSLNLFDYRGVHTYKDEDHWVAHWSYAMAKRIAFLRSVNVTRSGMASTSEAWLESELESLSTKEGIHPWLSETINRTRTPPRDVSFKLTSGRFEADGEISAGETSKDKSIGSGASATFEIKAGKDKVGTVTEDSINYKYVNPPKDKNASSTDEESEEEAPTPPGYLGYTTYHAFQHEGDATYHRYLEVEEFEHHTASHGELNLSHGSTSNRSLGSVRKGSFKARRKLAADLDVTPKTGFTNRIESPPKLLEEFRKRTPTAATRRQRDEELPRPTELETLERTIRFRLDLLAARGEKSKLERLKTFADQTDERIESLAEKAKKPQEHLESARETVTAKKDAAPSQLGSLSDGASSLVEGALNAAESLTAPMGDLSEKYSSAKESLTDAISDTGLEYEILPQSKNVYTRYFETQAVTLNTAQDGLSWKTKWVPQVYRGLSKSTLSFKAEQTIPIVPAVSAYFGQTLTVEATSSAFEVLGTETWSYLKMLYNACIGRAEFWTAFLAQHQGELFELCQRCADPQSTAFAELAHDALNGSPQVQEAANAFGLATWSFFNRRENPFHDGLTETKLIAALKPPVARQKTPPPKEPSDPTPYLPPRPKPRAPEDQPAFKEAFLRDVLARLDETERSGVQGYLDSVTQSQERTHARPDMEASLASGTELDFQYLAESAQAIMGALPVVQRLPKRQGLPSTTLEKVIDTELRDLLLRRNQDINTWRQSAAPLKGNPIPSTLDERHDLMISIKALLRAEYASLLNLDQWTRQLLGDAHRSNFMSTISEHQASERSIDSIRKRVLSDVLRITKEPTGIISSDEWNLKSKEGIPFYISRSSGTKELDQALTAYHQAMSALGTSTQTQRNQTTAEKLHAYFLTVSAQAGHLQELEQAIDRWCQGRDPKSSRRLPHVVTHLQIPIKKRLGRLAALTECVWIAKRVTDLLEYEQLLDEALSAYEDFSALLIQHAWQNHVMVKKAKKAHLARVAAKAAKEQQAAKVIQRAWRSKQAKSLPKRYELINETLAAYLESTHEQFQNESLALGRQKTLAPGQTIKVEEVEWIDPDKATSTTPNSSTPSTPPSTTGRSRSSRPASPRTSTAP